MGGVCAVANKWEVNKRCRGLQTGLDGAPAEAAVVAVNAAPPVQCTDGAHDRPGRSIRLFFFSREETRIHVHVAHPDGEAKFWLTPTVDLATNIGLSLTQVRQAQAVVQAHIGEIEDAWRRHFGG